MHLVELVGGYLAGTRLDLFTVNMTAQMNDEILGPNVYVIAFIVELGVGKNSSLDARGNV